MSHTLCVCVCYVKNLNSSNVEVTTYSAMRCKIFSSGEV